MSSENKVHDSKTTGNLPHVDGLVIEVGSSPTSKIRFVDRLEHFTWAWFTMTMATGGLALAVHSIPFKFPGLHALSFMIFGFNVACFLVFAVMISIRFLRFRWTLKASLLHPTEALFVSAPFLTVATIIMGCQMFISDHTGPRFTVVMRTMFWCYSFSALAFTVGIHILIWTTQTHTVDNMTPLWILPIYPMLLVGPLGGAISASQPPDQALDIFLCSIAMQGMGFMISMMIYSAYIYRLMTLKLPEPRARPGMFVSVGPSAFTVTGLVSLGQAAPKAISVELLGDDGLILAKFIQFATLSAGVWLWGLASWFFLVSCAANFKTVRSGTLHYSLGWWSFIFPNCAFVLATFAVAGALDSTVVKACASAFTALLVVIWVAVLILTARAVVERKILWENRGENRDEGGFHNQHHRSINGNNSAPIRTAV